MSAFRIVVLVGGLSALLCAGTAQGQVYTPSFASPRLINDIGVYVSDGPGELAIEGIWRRGLAGLRLGYLDHADGLASIGAEIRSPFELPNAPLSLAFGAAVQGVIGAESAIGVQAGLLAGYTLLQPGLALTPYLHPRVAVLNEIGEDEVRARALADLGLDLEFWNGMVIRIGAALSDVGANWGVGVGLRR